MKNIFNLSIIFVSAFFLTHADSGVSTTELYKSKNAKPLNLKDLSSLEKDYSQSGKDGFMIVTTNDLTHNLKNFQKYVSHKANYRKFNVFVATENDYEKNYQVAIDARKRGAFPGRVRGK